MITSDLHDCEPVWYEVTSSDRMGRLIRDLGAEYEKEPFDMLLMLGDYSLDFWVCPPFGSVLNRGTSYTEKFMKDVYPHLPPCPKYMIAGNHEQYGHENWKRITGHERRVTVPYGDYLFIILDNFGGDLDPTVNSDGTYTPSDLAYIHDQMESYPNTKVFLCAHDFNMEKETPEFCELLKREDRIICLFAGHTHRSDITDLGEACGHKCLIRDGQFSYSRDIENSRWGWREVRFHDDGSVTTAYITPDSDMVLNGVMCHHDAGKQDEMVLIAPQ
jgi:predicted phosphodiesterase